MRSIHNFYIFIAIWAKTTVSLMFLFLFIYVRVSRCDYHTSVVKRSYRWSLFHFSTHRQPGVCIRKLLYVIVFSLCVLFIYINFIYYFWNIDWSLIWRKSRFITKNFIWVLIGSHTICYEVSAICKTVEETHKINTTIKRNLI